MANSRENKLQNKSHAGLVAIISAIYLLSWGTLTAQKITKENRSRNFFAEIGGSGLVLTGNIDFRLLKGQTYGSGLRFGFGGGKYSTEYLLGFGKFINKYISVPAEFNYLFGKRRFAIEVGYGITYVHINEESDFTLGSFNTRDSEVGNFIVSYLPIGFRLKPQNRGLFMKLNLGPVFNYSSPNLWSYDKVDIYGGLAIGYSFFNKNQNQQGTNP